MPGFLLNIIVFALVNNCCTGFILNTPILFIIMNKLLWSGTGIDPNYTGKFQNTLVLFCCCIYDTVCTKYDCNCLNMTLSFLYLNAMNVFLQKYFLILFHITGFVLI